MKRFGEKKAQRSKFKNADRVHKMNFPKYTSFRGGIRL